jgi:hypothetical protein
MGFYFCCKKADELDKKHGHSDVIKTYIYFQCLFREGLYTDENPRLHAVPKAMSLDFR